MAQQTIDIGAAPNDGTGDPFRDAFDKCNDNFTELYGSLAGLLDFQGATDCSANPNYPAASQGDIYIVSVAGKIGGASGKVVEVGDFYLALADNAGGTEASVGTSWAVLQANITGGIGSGVDVEDEGVSEATGATTLNFIGAGVSAVDAGGGVVDITIPGGAGADGNLIGKQIITATGAGTYTPTAGTNSIVIEMVGGGGGGAGVPSAGANNGSRNASGSGGAYLRKRLTANFSGASYSVGAKGTGGASGANAGNNGGNTTFTDTAGSPTVYTAGGGTGGATSTATTPVQTGVPTAGGAATNGDLNIPGGPSDLPMILITSGGGHSGRGGSSHFSPGGIAIRVSSLNTSTAGANAGGYGGGGSAAYCQGTGSAQAGGDGSDGILIIWEYS